MNQHEEEANRLLDEYAAREDVTLADLGILTPRRMRELRQREVPLSMFEGTESATEMRARDHQLAIARRKGA